MRATGLHSRNVFPPNVDEWTHWEHGPDNNPVSSDSAIKAPYMTQFMAPPDVHRDAVDYDRSRGKDIPSDRSHLAPSA